LLEKPLNLLTFFQIFLFIFLGVYDTTGLVRYWKKRAVSVIWEKKIWKKRKIEKKREYYGRIMGRLKLKPKGLSGEN
jgi:hypothetical protein